MNIEKLLADAGIHLLDTEIKQHLYLLTIVCHIYDNCNDVQIRKQCELYFKKFLEQLIK